MQEKVFPAVLESIPLVTAWIDEALEGLDCPLKAQTQIDVAVDEIFGNIAHYAYPGGEGSAAVRLEFDADEKMIAITFTDEGIPFDPLEQAEPDVTLGAEDRQIGGLGIYLVKKTMDEVTYQFREGRNILRLKKRIG